MCFLGGERVHADLGVAQMVQLSSGAHVNFCESFGTGTRDVDRDYERIAIGSPRQRRPVIVQLIK
jgi:hypothetical protein